MKTSNYKMSKDPFLLNSPLILNESPKWVVTWASVFKAGNFTTQATTARWKFELENNRSMI